MPLTLQDRRWMERALALAARGRWGVAPNPRVGCVIVHEGSAIAEGWHAQVGCAHAEVDALDALDSDDPRLSSSTAYVTLEPCNHQGRTPPCTDRMIASGIPRVVVGMVDPDPRVAGSGITRMRDAGLEVVLFETLPEGRWLNRRFLSSLERGRPWVVLKCALSADGFMDPPRSPGQKGSLPITSPGLRRLTHSWRAEEEAILVGSGTVNVDNPGLDTREHSGRNPIPVVMDPEGWTSSRAQVYAHPKAMVLGGPAHLPDHVTRIAEPNGSPIEQVLSHLQTEGIRSVLVEGGASTLGHFFASGLWDEVRWCQSPSTTGGGLLAPAAPKEVQTRGMHPFAEDTVRYDVHPTSAAWVGCAPPPTLSLPLPS